MQNHSLKFNYETSILIQMMIYILSYNFHTLWLLCDIIILFQILYIIKIRALPKLKLFTFLFALITIYFAYTLSRSGFKLISFLSFWDTFKHIFVVLFTFEIFDEIGEKRRRKFIKNMYSVSLVTFIFQIIIVFIQRIQGLYIDNIAGSFGDGASHSLAYFSLFVLIFFITQKINFYRTIYVCLFGLIMNYFADNVGYYLILMITFFFIFKERINFFKMIVIVSIIFLLLIIFITTYDAEFLEKFTGRISRFSITEKYKGQKWVAPERGIITGYAIYLGGLFGRGYGAYSEIYGMNGWLIKTLIIKQICISEATHLLSETGVLGLISTITLYFTLFIKLIKNINLKSYTIILLLLAFFYNRILMDERIFFFLFLSIFIWNLSLKKENIVTKRN